MSSRGGLELQCPLCSFKTDDQYRALLHFETSHSEGASPFVATEEAAEFVTCPVTDCGEVLAAVELDCHMELHSLAEPGPPDEAARDYASSSTPPAGRSHPDPSSSVRGGKEKQSVRLGKAELGKYADEERMPSWLVSLLRKEKYVSTQGLIPVIGQLLQQNKSTQYAFLCHHSVQHISKLRKEGGFCGYRNIQMLCSYIIGSDSEGAHTLHSRIPSVFRIQDYIEAAWDKGINARGRVETGGILGTRKYIGTPEAQALLLSLHIPCEAQAFMNPKPSEAEALLVSGIERYFRSCRYDPKAKVRYTTLPPIYFQHRGHSLTIIGIEKRSDGAMELLVFDPMFHDSASITKFIGRDFQHRHPNHALKAYRRGSRYLRKYNEFEILK